MFSRHNDVAFYLSLASSVSGSLNIQNRPAPSRIKPESVLWKKDVNHIDGVSELQRSFV